VWAQLIQMRVKPDEGIDEMMSEIRAAEQDGSGLVRSIVLRDQSDPTTFLTLVVFESEELARAREQDPRRHERLATARQIMADVLDGPPVFTDLEVVAEWTGAMT
jgi:quinol monooxygenase YgiN